MTTPVHPTYEDEAVITLTVQGPGSITQDLPERRVLLSKDTPVVHIGRTSSHKEALKASVDNFWFECPVISRNHAHIKFDSDKKKLLLKDSGSLHGTLLNSCRVQSHVYWPLSAGDSITLGTQVDRGSNNYRPCVLVVDIMFGTAKHNHGPKVYKVPDDSESEDAGSDRHDALDYGSNALLSHGVLPSSKTPNPIDLTTPAALIDLSSDHGDGTDDESPFEDDDDTQILSMHQHEVKSTAAVAGERATSPEIDLTDASVHDVNFRSNEMADGDNANHNVVPDVDTTVHPDSDAISLMEDDSKSSSDMEVDMNTDMGSPTGQSREYYHNFDTTTLPTNPLCPPAPTPYRSADYHYSPRSVAMDYGYTPPKAKIDTYHLMEAPISYRDLSVPPQPRPPKETFATAFGRPMRDARRRRNPNDSSVPQYTSSSVRSMWPGFEVLEPVAALPNLAMNGTDASLGSFSPDFKSAYEFGQHKKIDQSAVGNETRDNVAIYPWTLPTPSVDPRKVKSHPQKPDGTTEQTSDVLPEVACQQTPDETLRKKGEKDPNGATNEHAEASVESATEDATEDVTETATENATENAAENAIENVTPKKQDVTIRDDTTVENTTPGSAKRKADHISTLVPAEQIEVPTSSLELPHRAQNLCPRSIQHPAKLQRVAEVFGYAALGGLAVMGTLIATAPTL
ncbi:hypothetical protein N3K66_004397 [Trichothecium roseum]|uniref:Uncharacterized protein n=1 Tax=Trichothecium roseum TaxID=47278 RepID=A0ACC0V156_9HYPO|nr:hypothetical protein N3K66_004397 [Trichothecium roseum]